MKRFVVVLCIVLSSCAVPSVTPGSDPDAGIETAAGPSDAGSRDGGPRCLPACTAPTICLGGECVLPECQPHETRCGAVCVDTQTDKTHCGNCTASCRPTGPGESVCVNGECSMHCPNDEPTVLCQPPARCTMGRCCGAGLTWCGESCTQTGTDLANCGACGNACIAPANSTATCSGGGCSTTCFGGFSSCGGNCVNYQTDANNCGSCNRSCNGAACVAGKCIVATTVCTISSVSGWQTCGTEVAMGDVVNLTATGSWSHYPDRESLQGPGGTSRNAIIRDYRYDRSFNFDALLWRLGTGSPHVFDASGIAGGDILTTATVSFRINDEDDNLMNNEGTMTVTMVVTRP